MNYAQKAFAADAQFRSKGQLITIKRTIKGGYSNGRVTTTTSTERAWGIETDLTSRDYGIGTAAGSLVQAGDRKLLLSAYADDGASLAQPSVGDVVNVGAQAYTVKNVDRTSPAGVVVMWTLVVRI